MVESSRTQGVLTDAFKARMSALRERINTHPLMHEGRLPSIGRELAYAIKDIRHKVVEEGWFGRQVTPSTFPRDDPPSPSIHGPAVPAVEATPEPGGPDIHGNGGPLAHRGLEGQVLGPEGPPPLDSLPPGGGPVLIDVEPATWQARETLRLGFFDDCRAVAQRGGSDSPAPDRGHEVAGPER